MATKKGPSHSLSDMQAAVMAGRYVLLPHVPGTALQVCCDRTDIEECILALVSEDFYKTMESEKRPGLWQDVYKRNHYGFPIYLKVQLGIDGQTVVISFKLDEDA